MSERLRMEAIDALLDENASLRRKVKELEAQLTVQLTSQMRPYRPVT